jgi:hypothetical protein
MDALHGPTTHQGLRPVIIRARLLRVRRNRDLDVLWDELAVDLRPARRYHAREVKGGTKAERFVDNGVEERERTEPLERQATEGVGEGGVELRAQAGVVSVLLRRGEHEVERECHGG